MPILTWFGANWNTIALVITGVISVASIIVKVTPTKRDDEALAKVLKVLAFFALTPKTPPVVAPEVTDHELQVTMERLIKGKALNERL
jgi:hypothetical protein